MNTTHADDRIRDIESIAVVSPTLQSFKDKVNREINWKGSVTFYGKVFTSYQPQFDVIFRDYCSVSEE